MINFAPACERNKQVIGEQLQEIFADRRQVLEIGSGSGQHVLHFAQLMPHIQWQPMDFGDYFAGLQANLQQRAANILEPLELDLNRSPWLPERQFDGLFSANTLHIMSWDHVIAFFAHAGKQLLPLGKLCLYGPFKYHGEFTSPSNAEFERWLKSRDPRSGVRDVEAVVEQAQRHGFSLVADISMPANNQLLSFTKVG